MQLRQTKDHLPNRFNYYLARLHGSQDMEGKSYSQLKETIVMIFFNLILVDDDEICSTFTMRKWSGIPFVKESEDCMKLITVEMPKVDLKKPLSDMNEQEKMIYYFFWNCHKGMDDSKIKMMVEKDEVIQMLEKRVETISDDRWKKIIEDFRKLHENEERIELQLELEEAQKQVKEAHKAKEEARQATQEARKAQEDARKAEEEARKAEEKAQKQAEKADKKVEEAEKKSKEAEKKSEEAEKKSEEADKKVEEANKQVKQMVCKMYEDGFTLEQISAYCSLNVDEIELLIKS